MARLKICCLCEREGTGPTPASALMAGRRWDIGQLEWRLFHGYLCEMHQFEEVKNGSKLRVQKVVPV